MKKVLNYKVLFGFPTGIMMLMISYYCIYLICGFNVFENEIIQLTNTTTFIKQMIFSGIFYTLIFTLASIANSFEVINKRTENISIANIIKYVTCILLLMILIMCNDKLGNFSGNVSTIFICEAVLVFAIRTILSFAMGIKDLTAINKKIKDRNLNNR